MFTGFRELRDRVAGERAANYVPPTFHLQGEEGEEFEKQSFEQLLESLAECVARTWFVEGVAGSGKSTLLAHVATELLDREIACVFINPHSLRSADGAALADPKAWALDFRPAEVDAKLWKSRVKRKRCVFLIDGVNELEREFRSTTQWRFVRRLLEHGHEFPVLATGRSEPDGLGDLLLRPVERLSIAPFTPEQSGAYLSARGVDSAVALAEIRASGLDGSTWNPFFLSLLADLLVGERPAPSLHTPRSRAELLLATVDRGRARLTDDEQGLAKSGLHLEAALCAAAIAIFLTAEGAGRKDVANLRVGDIEVLLGKVWDDKKAVSALAAAFLHTQMVERLRGVGNDYGFRVLHPSLVDFGLALGWRGGQVPRMASGPYRLLDQCLGDWIGLQADPDEAARNWLISASAAHCYGLLIDIVVANKGRLGEDTQDRYWEVVGAGFLAGRPWSDDLARALGNLPPHLTREAVRRGLLRALRQRHPPLAEAMFEALRRGRLNQHSLERLYRRHRFLPAPLAVVSAMNLSVAEDRGQRGSSPVPRTAGSGRAGTADRAAVERLAVALADQAAPAEVRTAAAAALGKIGDHPAIETLAVTLADHTNPAEVRTAAATELGKSEDLAAIEALAPALADHTNPAEVRTAVAAALGKIGDHAAIEALALALADRTNPAEARTAAATALGEIGDPVVVALLATLLGSGHEPEIRAAAASALGHIGSPDAVAPLIHVLGERACPPDVRRAAITALGRIGHPAAVRLLMPNLGEENPDDIRGAAVTALGRIGSLPAVGPLLTILHQDRDILNQAAAATALGRIGDRAAIRPLAAALMDGAAPGNVRGSAATALGRFGDRAAIEPLIAALGDATAPGNVRGSAATALGQLGHRAAVDPLITALGDATAPGDVRGSAATAMGLLGDRTVVGPLATALVDGKAPGEVRGAAATALGQLGDRAAVDPLITALVDAAAPGGVRGSAATALGQLGDRTAVQPLATALADAAAPGNVRGAAATALGQLGDRTAVDPLTTALVDATAPGEVRGAAATALGQLGDRTAVDPLATALADAAAPGSVRGAAATALGRVGDGAAGPSLRRVIENDGEPDSIRTWAVNALAMLPLQPQAWLMPVADGLVGRIKTGDTAARGLRAAIVRLVGNRAAGGAEQAWLDAVARHDPHHANRMNAIRGLSLSQLISSDLIRYTIDPSCPRGDGRQRDSNNEARAEAVTAVIRMAEYSEGQFAELSGLVGDAISAEGFSPALWDRVLTPMRAFPVSAAKLVLDTLYRTLPPDPQRHLVDRLDRCRAALSEQMAVKSEFDLLRRTPEELLMAFHDEARSPFENRPPVAKVDSCDVAFLTAVDVETETMVEQLKLLGVETRLEQRRGRYYSYFQLAGGPEPVSAVLIQATEKGGQPASALTHDTLTEFKPSLVLLVGVAGGFAERGVRLYDVIVARNVFNYDPERIEPGSGGQRPQPYRTDEQLLRLVTHLRTHGELADILDGSKLHHKDYASGEKVIAWKEATLRKELLDLSTDVYGIETEAHGVLHAIWETFKADHFVGGAIIKCVSDLGDEDMTIDKATKQRHAATKAARLAIRAASLFRRE